MGRFAPACEIIYGLLFLVTVVLRIPNAQPFSDVCVLRTRRGIDIRASLKPSLSAQNNFRQTIDLSKARCCFDPDKRFPLLEPLNVTVDNVASLLQYPIRPLSMIDNNQGIPQMGVWDEIWYSLYKFGEPSLNQSVDVEITRKNSVNADEQTFSFHLSSDTNVSPPSHAEASARLVINPHRSPVREEDRIITEDIVLLFPEVTDNMRGDGTTRRRARYCLVASKSFFEFPSLDCFDEKACFPSLVSRYHRPQTVSGETANQRLDVFTWTKVKETDNQSRKTLLSALETLHDPAATSRHRSSVAFISQHPLILHIFIPNEETSLRSQVAGFLDTKFTAFALYCRHFGSFLTNQFTHTAAIILDCYDVIAQHSQLLATILKTHYSSAVDVLYSTAEQLCDLLGSFGKFDRIPFEKSIDYQWNLNWSLVDQTCHESSRPMVADVDPKMAAGLIVVTFITALIIGCCVTSRRNRIDRSIFPDAAINVDETDDANLYENNAAEVMTSRTDRDDCVGETDAADIPKSNDDDLDDYSRVINALLPPTNFNRTPGELAIAMDMDNKYECCKLLQRTISEPCINHEIAITNIFTSHCAAGKIKRCRSDYKIAYPDESQPRLMKVVIEPPKPRILKLVLKEPKKLPPPEDEGTDIDEEYYCYHKYYKEIIPLCDYYTYRPSPPAKNSKAAQQTTTAVPTTSQSGLHGLRRFGQTDRTKKLPKKDEYSDNLLLDLVIELSQTDEGTDIDKAYYLYHGWIKGTVSLLDHHKSITAHQTGPHYLRRIEQALLSAVNFWLDNRFY